MSIFLLLALGVLGWQIAIGYRAARLAIRGGHRDARRLAWQTVGLFLVIMGLVVLDAIP